MKCEICGKGPPEDDIAVFRQNEKGVPGIWRCRVHNAQPIDPEVHEVVHAIERDNIRKGEGR